MEPRDDGASKQHPGYRNYLPDEPQSSTHRAEAADETSILPEVSAPEPERAGVAPRNSAGHESRSVPRPGRGPRYYSGAHDSYSYPRGESARPWMPFLIFAALLAAAVLLGSFIYVVFLGPNRGEPAPKAAAPASSTTLTTVAPSPSSTQLSSSHTSPTLQPTTSEPTSISEPEPTPPPSSPAGLPQEARSCGTSGAWQVGARAPSTSCGLAMSVAAAAGAQPQGTVRAVSPTTGEAYQLQCASDGAGYRCTGAGDIAVFLVAR